MEVPEAAATQENEYMAMDTDQWDNNDDIYENGDTLEINTGQHNNWTGPSSARQKIETGNRIQTMNRLSPYMIHPLSDRYMTIRRPEPGANRGRNECIDFFRNATFCMVALCFLLVGALVILGIVHDKLAGNNLKVNERIETLLQENIELKAKMNLTQMNVSMYYISEVENPNCNAAKGLFIINDQELESYSGTSFFLYHSTVYNGFCYNQHSWNCTC